MEGSNLFSIHAYLPAEASFGFVDDMRRKSSGAAAASLMLSHWERLQAMLPDSECNFPQLPSAQHMFCFESSL